MGRHRMTSLFGCEGTAFQQGERGRNLFGSPDLDTVSSRKAREVFGRADAHGGKYDKTRHVFGDEMAEDSDEEDYFESNAGVIFIRGVEGELMLKKDIRHEHGVENLLNSLGASFQRNIGRRREREEIWRDVLFFNPVASAALFSPEQTGTGQNYDDMQELHMIKLG